MNISKMCEFDDLFFLAQQPLTEGLQTVKPLLPTEINSHISQIYLFGGKYGTLQFNTENLDLPMSTPCAYKVLFLMTFHFLTGTSIMGPMT